MSTPNSLRVIAYGKASDVPVFVWEALQQREVDANTVLPNLEKCRKQDQKGIIARDHLWLVVFVESPALAVKLVLSCTDSLTGKYPLFLFTPVSSAAMKDDSFMFPALTSAARHLQTLVPTHRIYSVFGRELLSRTFATIWTQQTNIHFIPIPYYHCKISYLTRTTFELNKREPASVATTQIRPATQADWEGVARLCFGFAADSDPFTLTEEGARAEAKQLITNGLVWVLTSEQHVASLVAFTRNSDKVATITKVFTDPTQRGGRYAERLVRAVCQYLLYDCAKERVALFVGLENRAANVYRRVGFVGVGDGAPPADGVDIWCEIGFHRSHVQLGHW